MRTLQFIFLLFFLSLISLTGCSTGAIVSPRPEPVSPVAQTDLQKNAVRECHTASELYKLHSNLFDGAAGSNDLIVMEKEADELLKLAAFRSPSPDFQPEKPWQNERDTLYGIIPVFERKQLPAAKLTEKYYTLLLATLPDGMERTEVELDLLHFLARLDRIAPAALRKRLSALPKGKNLSEEDRVAVLFACAMFDSIQRRSKDDPEGFCMPYDPHSADIDRKLLNRAIFAQQKIIASKKPSSKQYCDAWLVHLKLLTFANDETRFGKAVSTLEKTSPDRKTQWLDTVNACRSILAFGRDDLQNAYAYGKLVTMNQNRRDREFQACFMNSCLRTLCALKKYPEAYALKDRYLRIVVPGKYSVQRERQNAFFERLKTLR